MTQPLRVMSVVGARPNFTKIAPIVAQLQMRGGAFVSTLVHTGQHHDEQLSQVFFEELGTT
jgi:UDP-N-acetylglucosamine 2-epimerase (non-hydrolysing)